MSSCKPRFFLLAYSHQPVFVNRKRLEMSKEKGLFLAGLMVIAGGVLLYAVQGGRPAGHPPPSMRDAARYTLDTLRDFPWLIDPYGFERASPDKQGLEHSRIKKLSEDLAQGGTKGFLVLQNNQIVHEWYGGFHGAHIRYRTASLAKALVGSLVLLLAIDDGRIKMDDPAWRYIPGWRNDPLRSRITVGDLANHSSGIEHPEESEDFGDYAESWKAEYWHDHSERLHIALHVAPVLFPPGTHTSYSNPAYTALSYALAASLRGAPESDIGELLRTRIMQPLGVPDHHWTIGYGERFHQDGLTLRLFEGGGRYTTRAAARVGQLIGERGIWGGRQILSSGWIDSLVRGDMATQAPRPHWKPVSAIGWWSNAGRTWPHLPDDMLIGAGSGHQVVVVVPSYRLVVVRQGRSLGGPGWGKGYWQVLDDRLLRPLAEIIDAAASHGSQSSREAPASGSSASALFP